MKNAILTTILLFLCNSALGQVAVYRGVEYTPENYKRGANYTYPNCAMCNNIRSQWAAQGWISGYGVNKIMAAPKPVVKKEEPKNFRWELEEYTTTEPYQQRICHKNWRGVVTHCTYVTKYRKVTKTKRVKVPIEAPTLKVITEDDFEPTPQEVVMAMISLLDLTEDDVFVDPGCGDARLVIEAAKLGAKARGIEISSKIAEEARKNIKDNKVEAEVVHADFTTVDLKDATAVGVYLYDDMLQKLVNRLEPGTKIASYIHEVPGCKNKKVRTSKGNIYLATVPESDLYTGLSF